MDDKTLRSLMIGIPHHHTNRGDRPHPNGPCDMQHDPIGTANALLLNAIRDVHIELSGEVENAEHSGGILHDGAIETLRRCVQRLGAFIDER